MQSKFLSIEIFLFYMISYHKTFLYPILYKNFYNINFAYKNSSAELNLQNIT